MPRQSDPISISNRQLLMLGLLLLLIRVMIAYTLPLFGDEAFYWQESRALAMSYTDLPPMTAWLIALGTKLAGDSAIGVRWPFLLMAAAIPWLLRSWALWRLSDEGDANRVALFAMCMPLLAMSGVLALPDVPLTLAMLAAFVHLDRAAESDRSWHWVVLGLCLALALLTHWRAATLCLAGLVWVLATPRGRRVFFRPGFWLALFLGLIGLVPALVFNATHDWVALRFQAIDRNPWTYQASGWGIALEQWAVVTPFLAGLLLIVAWRSFRQRRRGPDDLLVAAAIGIVLVYAVVGLFADNERMRVHWPLPGYLPLLLALPLLLREGWAAGGAKRLWVSCAFPFVALGGGFSLLVLAAAASPNVRHQILATKVLEGGFIGWTEAAAATRTELGGLAAGSVVIADNFLLAAELDFALRGERPVYVLDHPRNIKHGRQAQLALWRRDEASLLGARWAHGLLVVEAHARAPGDQLAAWQGICRRFGEVRWLREERVVGGIRFLFAEVSPRIDQPGQICRAPVLAHMDAPLPNQAINLGEPLLVQGWAIADGVGVADVSVLVDGARLGSAQTRLPAPHVQLDWPNSDDPDHPNVGFSARIESDALSIGRHEVEIEVRTRAAGDLVRRFGPVTVMVTP